MILIVTALYSLGAVLAAVYAVRRDIAGKPATWLHLLTFSLAMASLFFLLATVELPFRRAMIFYAVVTTQTVAFSYILLQIRKPTLTAPKSELAFGAAMGSALIFLVNGILLPRFRSAFSDPSVLLHTLIWCSAGIVGLGQVIARWLIPLSPEVRVVYRQRLGSVLGRAALLQVIYYAALLWVVTLLKTDTKLAAKVGAVLGILGIHTITLFRHWIIKGCAPIASEVEQTPVSTAIQRPAIPQATASSAPQPQKLGKP